MMNEALRVEEMTDAIHVVLVLEDSRELANHCLVPLLLPLMRHDASFDGSRYIQPSG